MKLISVIYRFAFLLFMLTLISSCEKELTSDELEKYIQNPENGTKKSFESGSFKAEIIYRPTDLMVKQELTAGKKDIEALRKNYGQYNYFVLNMRNNDADLLNITASNKSVFAGINEQLSFSLNEHVYLLDENKDTSYLVDFAFPRLYEAAKSTSVLLAFKALSIKTNKFKICLKDIAYTTGIIEFDYDKQDFKNIPSLKL